MARRRELVADGSAKFREIDQDGVRVTVRLPAGPPGRSITGSTICDEPLAQPVMLPRRPKFARSLRYEGDISATLFLDGSWAATSNGSGRPPI